MTDASTIAALAARVAERDALKADVEAIMQTANEHLNRAEAAEARLAAILTDTGEITDEMVEAVARKICDVWGYEWDAPEDDPQHAPEDNFDYDERPSKRLYREAARAVAPLIRAPLVARVKILTEALRSVDRWWLETGMHEPGRIGAPACMFGVRAALSVVPVDVPQPDPAEIARRARAEALDDAIRALRARYDLLHADALARQRGVYLDGSPRRETVPVPADPMAQPFTPVTLGGGTGSTSADPARNKLVAALKEIDALANPIAEQAQDAGGLRRRIYHIRQAASSALALARIEDDR